MHSRPQGAAQAPRWLSNLVRGIRAWYEDAREAQWILELGAMAFGPPGPLCGKPRFELAPRRAREVLNRMSVRQDGKPLDGAPGLCHCFDEGGTTS